MHSWCDFFSLPSRKTYEIADGCHKNSIFTSLLAAKLTEAAKTSLPSEVGEEVVKVMNDTKEGTLSVLVCTTCIELIFKLHTHV